MPKIVGAELLVSVPQLRPGKEVVLVGAIELARAAAEETASDATDVGDYAGVVIDGERLVTHYFAATMPGYPGWCWAVTLARAPRARVATVCEVALLPQAGALLAPAWLPWSERLRPEDIGVGDVLPFRADDPRLVAGWTGDEDSEYGPSLEELAVARQRVLGEVGTADAAQRWYRGSHGPTAPVAVAATAPCQSCGFLVRLAGSLGQMFGVCANEWAPDDGQVVSFDHGCGAHSETDIEQNTPLWPESAPPIDDLDVGLNAFDYEDASVGREDRDANTEGVSVGRVPAEGGFIETTEEAETTPTQPPESVVELVETTQPTAPATTPSSNVSVGRVPAANVSVGRVPAEGGFIETTEDGADVDLTPPAPSLGQERQQPDAEADQASSEPAAGDDLPEQPETSERSEAGDERGEEPQGASDD